MSWVCRYEPQNLVIINKILILSQNWEFVKDLVQYTKSWNTNLINGIVHIKKGIGATSVKRQCSKSI